LNVSIGCGVRSLKMVTMPKHVGVKALKIHWL